MEDWGNIIYLIIMALFVVFGAIKKKKPAVPVSPPDDGEVFEQDVPTPQVQKQPGTDFNSVLEALLGQEVPEPYVEPGKDVAEEVQLEKEVELKSEPEPEHKPESIEYTKVRQTTTFDDLMATYSEEEDEEVVEQEEIDWRKAIIYKEILDRKYT
jgi:hypothetical protein